MNTTKRKYGWRPQLPDARDRKLKLAPRLAPLPPSVDLRGDFMPPIYDQGQIGSCTANAIAAAYEYERLKQGLPALSPSGNPSRLFIYFNERKMEGTVGQDAGAMIRDGIKSLAVQGVCDESLWPYDESNLIVTPPQAAYDAALADLAIEYQSPNQDACSLKAALASGVPFVVGISVFDSFESADVEKWGEVPMPDLDNESMIGGHAICIVGYDDSKQAFWARNSWGTFWGLSGYFTIPYDYILNKGLASDFWVIKRVT